MSADGVGAIVGDRYQIVCELGRGGMGVVYLGRDLRREMDVAIKLCVRTRPDAMLWLKREFRVVSSLRHPNLVELYELVAHERSCYFTMEYLVGIDPREWVAGEGHRAEYEESTSTLAPLRAAASTPSSSRPVFVDFSRVRALLVQLAEAIAFLHARGVIHRDIKPSNVLVTNDTAKLLDFGIAIERRRIQQEVARERRIVGTNAYLAPEYVAELTVTPALDVYALGVLAFELVTGNAPFGRVPYGAGEHQTFGLPLASRINPEVPRDLEQLIDQMLAANPMRRPSALDVATRLTSVLTHPRPVRSAKYFVGRPRELTRLDAHIADRTPRARFVAVSGPSGAGKSALVDEAVGRARITGTLPAIVWRGRCHERELIPYRGFDFVVDDLAAELARDPRLADGVEHTGALGRVFPSLGALLELGPAAEDPRVERERALIAMAQLFDRAIGEQSGLVVIDDLQWADEASLELLAIVIARVTRPLAIIATWSEDVPASIVAELGERAEILALPVMAHDEVAELISEVAPNAPTERIRAAATLAAGNPYLAELIGRELADTGLVDPQHTELGHRALDRLSPAERAVAELAALATSVISFEQLRALADQPPAQLVSVLRALEDAHVVKVTPSTSGDPVYTVYHELLRDAARSAIPTDIRRALHLRFAMIGERDHGPPEQLAHHYEHAGARDRAAHWACVAADAARTQLAWGVAVDWYERAIALGTTGLSRSDEPDPRPNQRAMQAQLAECLFFAGRLADAASLFEQLAARDAPAGARWRVRAAEAYIKLGELERGLAIVDGVLAGCGEPRARTRIASASRTLVVAARWLAPGRSRAPVDPVLVAAYRVIASFLSTPYPIEAFEYVVRGIAAAERAGDRDAQALGMAMLAVYLTGGTLGRFGDRALAAAHRLSEQSATPYPRMVAAGAAGIVATLRGDWEGMRRTHDEGHRICIRLGLQRSWEASFLRTYQALGEYYAGEPERALAILDELTDASDDLISRAMLGSYRGRALLQTGDLVAARAQQVELERSPATGRGLAGIYRQVFAGELALADRDWSRAEALGHEAARTARAQWLTMIPALSVMTETLIATAEIGSPHRDAAARALRRARALHRRAGHSFYAATALRLRGQAELRLGNTAAADRVLARAAAVAAERGGKVDRIAIARLIDLVRGRALTDPGRLGLAVMWTTGGMV